MFTKNAPAREYKGLWVFGATNSSSYGASAVNQGASADSVVEVTYGNAYSATVHGFKVTFQTHTTNLGVSSYSVDFESPWWSGNLATGASFLAAGTVDIDIVNCLHNCGCNAWSLSFDSMTIKYGGATIHTIGATSQSGSGYDPRNDRTFVKSDAGPYLTITFGKPNCESYSVRNDYTYNCSGTTTIEGFWEWKESGGSFTSDTIVYDTLPTLPNLGCIGCATSLVSPTGTTSSTLADSASYSYSVSVNDLADFQCLCEPAGTLVSNNHYWQTIFGVNSQLSQGAYFVPNVSPIRAHDYRVQETCTLDSGGPFTYDSGWVNVVDSVGTSIYTSQTESGTYTTWCSERYGRTFPCASPPNTTVCAVDPLPSDVFCHMVGSLDMRWPTKPPCADPLARPIHKQFPWGMMAVAWISAGDVFYKGCNFTVPYLGWDQSCQATFVGDVVGVAFDQDVLTCRIWMYVTRFTAGVFNLYQTYTDSWGSDFLSPMVLIVSSPAFPAFRACQNGDWFLAWAQYVSGTSGPMNIYGQYHYAGQGHGTTGYPEFTPPLGGSGTIMVDHTGTALVCADGQFGNVDMAFDWQQRLTLTFTVDGESTPSIWWSLDCGVSWVRV